MDTLSQSRLNLYRDYTIAKVIHHCATVLVSFGLTLAGLMSVMSTIDYANRLYFAKVAALIGIGLLFSSSMFSFVPKTSLGQACMLIGYGVTYGLIVLRLLVIFNFDFKELAIAAGITCALMGIASWIVDQFGADKKVIMIAKRTLQVSIIVSLIVITGYWLGLISARFVILIYAIKIVFGMCAMLVFAGVYTNMAYKINPTSKEEADEQAFTIGLMIAIIAIDIFQRILVLYGSSKKR